MTFGCFNEQRTITQRERALMWVLSISCHLSLSITVCHCGKRIVRTMLLQSELFQTFTVMKVMKVMKVMNVMKVMKVKVTEQTEHLMTFSLNISRFLGRTMLRFKDLTR